MVLARIQLFVFFPVCHSSFSLWSTCKNLLLCKILLFGQKILVRVLFLLCLFRYDVYNILSVFFELNLSYFCIVIVKLIQITLFHIIYHYCVSFIHYCIFLFVLLLQWWYFFFADTVCMFVVNSVKQNKTWLDFIVFHTPSYHDLTISKNPVLGFSPLAKTQCLGSRINPIIPRTQCLG